MPNAKNKDGRVRNFTETSWSKMSKTQRAEWTVEPKEARNTVKVPAPKEVEPEKQDAPVVVVTSNQMTVADATVKISSMTTEEEVFAFVVGDERVGVKNALEKKLEDLKK